MAYDKESTKLSYYDLAPSLQAKIGGLANVDQYVNTRNLINTIYARNNTMVVTEGPSEPVNGSTKGADNVTPLSIVNDKAIHYNTTLQVLEYYHGSAWQKHHLVYG